MDQNTKDVLMVTVPLAGTALSAWIAYKVQSVASNVLRVEKATNGHTEMLVAATKAAAHGEGKEEERVEQRQRDKEAAP